MGTALNTNGDQAMQQVNFLARGVFPEKLDAAIAQLEAEPAGVGLDPAAVYEGLSHAASAVLAAVARLAISGACAGPRISRASRASPTCPRSSL
jgi:hypothetical protein